nr:hypothetical protein [Tanacetum cinerariifolium]
MVDSLPTMVDKHIKEQVQQQVPKQLCLSVKDDLQSQQQDIAISLALQMKFERLQVPQTTCRTPAVGPRDQNDPHDDAHPEGGSAKRQKTSEYETYVSGESSPGQDNEQEKGPSTLAPALSLINQDLLYLKKGNSGPEKIVLSLHKFLANSHAKIFYIRKQKEPRKPKEVIYSNSKIVQVIKTYWELGHEHKFITEIIARRANDCIVLITEPDFKNLNKNDIEDLYLQIMNGKVLDYGLLWSLSVFIRSSVIWERVHDFQLRIKSYQQKVNLTAPTISFP